MKPEQDKENKTDIIVLNKEQSEKLWKNLDNPPKPNKELKNLLKE